MVMKDIAVFVDPTPDGDDWLRFAASIARTHKARLTGVYVVGHSRPFPSYVRGHYAIQSLIANWFVSEQRCAVQKRKRFTKVVEQYKIQTNFRVVCSDTDTNGRIVLNSVLADMVVIGQKAPHGLPDGWRPEHLLSACGVPLLGVPTGWQDNMVAERIIIAWNASKEARPAIPHSTPLLAAPHARTGFAVDPNDE